MVRMLVFVVQGTIQQLKSSNAELETEVSDLKEDLEESKEKLAKSARLLKKTKTTLREEQAKSTKLSDQLDGLPLRVLENPEAYRWIKKEDFEKHQLYMNQYQYVTPESVSLGSGSNLLTPVAKRRLVLNTGTNTPGSYRSTAAFQYGYAPTASPMQPQMMMQPQPQMMIQPQMMMQQQQLAMRPGTGGQPMMVMMPIYTTSTQ
jgi:hypothetical protein